MEDEAVGTTGYGSVIHHHRPHDGGDDGPMNCGNGNNGTSERRRNYFSKRRRSSRFVYKTFFEEFDDAHGNNSNTGGAGWWVILLGFLAAVGVGSIVGVIPQITTQHYAEHIFGLQLSTTSSVETVEVELQCNSFRHTDIGDGSHDKPLACVQGAYYAQRAVSICAFAKHALGLLSNSLAGSYSDKHGRRGIQIFLLFLFVLPPIALLLLQTNHLQYASFYFALEAFTGTVNFFSIAFTQLSDTVSPRHRATAFGLFMGAFMGGIAVAPFMATIMTHLQVTVFSTSIRILALMIGIFFLPETLNVRLPEDPIDPKAVAHLEAGTSQTTASKAAVVGTAASQKATIQDLMLRPLYEMTILQRNQSIMLVAVGAFLSKFVFSADVTLFFYYIENTFGASDRDVAGMMFVAGIFGVLVQAGLLKYLISLLGEHFLLVTSFLSGMIHNLIYGMAPAKWVLYMGLCLSQLSNTNGPLLSSMASRNVSDSEQGRIQGALFALTSLAEAIGPLCLNYVYRNWHAFGPGSMFVVGSVLYCVGSIAVFFIPPKASARKIMLSTHSRNSDISLAFTNNESEGNECQELLI